MRMDDVKMRGEIVSFEKSNEERKRIKKDEERSDI